MKADAIKKKLQEESVREDIFTPSTTLVMEKIKFVCSKHGEYEAYRAGCKRCLKEESEEFRGKLRELLKEYNVSITADTYYDEFESFTLHTVHGSVELTEESELRCDNV